jgi:probable HAF family extracellular repeat protein
MKLAQLLTAALTLCCADAHAQPHKSTSAARYTITQLGGATDKESSASGINKGGHVVGWVKGADGHTHAFIYAGKSLRILKATGHSESEATGINNAGQVVGVVGDEVIKGWRTPRACLFLNERVTIPATLGGTGSWAYEIDDKGRVAGDSYTRDHHQRPVLYYHGTIKDLGTLGGSQGRANSINASGQVVGESETAAGHGHNHAFLYYNGHMNDVGTLGGQTSRANCINRYGLIVGTAQVKGGPLHAFSFKAGRMRDLGTLGGKLSEARGVNDRSQIVGYAENSALDDRAFLFENGTMHDLNGEIDRGSGWILTSATAINASGWIVGEGRFKGRHLGFLLRPKPESRKR